MIMQATIAQTTTIWIVRHAEKDKTNPKDPNPDLSEEGKKRAEDLAVYLKDIKFEAAYCTPLKRTHQTLAPLVEKNKLSVTDYNDVKTLVEGIKKNNPGQTVIVAGHTNTILETIEAFGAQRPLPALEEDDFDYIFRITLDGDTPGVKTDTYGQPHHSNPK